MPQGYMEKLQKKYEHSIDRLYDLFKAGLAEELRLHDRVDTLEDELRRIMACPGVTSEIIGLCKRGLNIDEFERKAENSVMWSRK